MTLTSILTKTSAFKVFVSLLLGSLAGISYAMLIPLVTNSFTQPGELPSAIQSPTYLLGFEVTNYKFAITFLVACVLIFVTRTLSQLLLTWVVVDATSKLRSYYYKRIIESSLSQLEKVGFSRLVASITTDVQKIVAGAQVIPDVLISGVTLIGMMLFLLYLDTDVFLFVCGAIVFGAVTFQIPIIMGNRFFRRSREKTDNLQEAIRGTVFGIKELKLCAEKRNSFFCDNLLRTENEVRSANKKGVTIIRAAMNYGDMVSFFVIGYVAFVFVNYHAISTDVIIGSVMVLLYITGPLAILMNSSPEIALANVSLAKVDKLFSDLVQEPVKQEVLDLPEWQSLSFKQVCYHYETESNDNYSTGFSVGPISFELNRGEVNFIVGGNGSGKSTLSKLITSHYLIDSGSIYLGQTLIDLDKVNSYRNQVSAVFTDYHLFDRLQGVLANVAPETVQHYLEKLHLSEKVTVENGRFSTLALSDGQRKRLALLVALLEDKNIYLFDEWAADQDPVFKEIFYHSILPELKSKNKLIVAISHDDRYFDLADRILVMEQGQLQLSQAKLLRESA